MSSRSAPGGRPHDVRAPGVLDSMSAVRRDRDAVVRVPSFKRGLFHMSLRAFLRARARGAVVLVAAAAALAGSLVGAATAEAQSTEATFTVTGDAGDTVTGGNSYAYDAGSGATFTVRSIYTGVNNNNTVFFSAKGVNGDQWNLYLQAPAGQTLAPGDYTGATKYVGSTPSQPALYFSSPTKSCTTVTGSFSVSNVVFAPNNGVQELDATFEQHCNGATAASYGRIHITNPAPLTLDAPVAADGTFSELDGNATVHGTVTCNTPANVSVSGTVTQVAHRIIIRGSFPTTTVACTPGAPVPWSGTAVPTGTTPFQHGDVEVTAKATATDPFYGGIALANETASVTLQKA
jgi:hypothetical protein